MTVKRSMSSHTVKKMIRKTLKTKGKILLKNKKKKNPTRIQSLRRKLNKKKLQQKKNLLKNPVTQLNPLLLKRIRTTKKLLPKGKAPLLNLRLELGKRINLTKRRTFFQGT